MNIAEFMVGEFDHEAANTRKVLARVPDAHASWKPHAKSWSMGELALHLANLPTWVARALQSSEFDIEPPGSTPSFPKRVWVSQEALLKTFDDNVAAARALIAATPDAEMMKPWTLKKRGDVVLTLPRAAVLRSFVFNHSIHHRGQMTVYLRMKDIPVPFLYGPTADEAQ
jgi:uncharacterized damage-inducible protein DinB